MQSVILRARRLQYKRSFIRFIKRAFPIAQKGQPYIHGKHVDIMAAHLQALAEKKIRRLLMNVPPSTGKSTIMGVLFPAWVWSFWPQCKIQVFAYNDGLAKRDQTMTRDLIGSDWYRSLFPEVEVKYGQDSKGYFQLTAGGERRIGAPASGMSTGGHSDIYLFDDLMDAEKAESPRARERVNNWYFRTMSTRGVARDSVHCIGVQRLHIEDLSGAIIERDKTLKREGRKSPWHVVSFPMRYDPELAMEDRGFGSDWRTKPGELLFPEVLSEQAVSAMELQLGSHDARCQLQQDPRRRDGNTFKVTRIKTIDPADVQYRKFVKRIRFWDLAGTDEADNKNACYTAGVLLGFTTDDRVVVLDVVRKQVDADDVDGLMDMTAAQDEQEYGRLKVALRFEREPGSSGKKVAKILCRRLKRYGARDVSPEGNKEVRAQPIADAVARHEVEVVAAPWTREFLEELTQFPGGKYKDQVDALSGAYMEHLVPDSKDGEMIIADNRNYEEDDVVRCRCCNERPAFQGDYCCDACANAGELGSDEEIRHTPRCNSKWTDWFATKS